MNILCGVLNQTEGKVYIDGTDLQESPEKAKRLLGFLPQQAPLHLDLTVDEYLTYCAHIRDIKHTKSSVNEVKAKCGISDFGKRLIRNLSGGYRQRVGIAQAIIHQPKLVVLDEPTNGLDPNQIQEVRKLIREIAEERAVIFSSHILSEVQATCKDIRMIEGGRMVFADTMEAFNNYILPNSMLVFMQNPPNLNELKTVPGITGVELLHDQSIRMRFSASATISQQIIKMSVEKDWQLSEITLEKSSLDEIFAQLSNSVSK
jgi:ABC-2 type transport system ATP-binding protein